MTPDTCRLQLLTDYDKDLVLVRLGGSDLLLYIDVTDLIALVLMDV